MRTNEGPFCGSPVTLVVGGDMAAQITQEAVDPLGVEGEGIRGRVLRM